LNETHDKLLLSDCEKTHSEKMRSESEPKKKKNKGEQIKQQQQETTQHWDEVLCEVSSIRTPMLIQGRLERTGTNLIQWDSAQRVTSFLLLSAYFPGQQLPVRDLPYSNSLIINQSDRGGGVSKG